MTSSKNTDVLASDEEMEAFPEEAKRSHSAEREYLADLIEKAMNEKFDIGHMADVILAGGFSDRMTKEENKHEH
jgi:hypothetical protein